MSDSAPYEASMTQRPWMSVLLLVNLMLVSLLVVEAAARIGVYGIERWRPDYRAGADGYFGATWTRDYYREFAASGGAEWRPYVYWRRPPFAGRFINVDAEGIRRTWKAATGDAERTRIFVMGGSTAWGTGARDDYTLPSELAKGLFERGRAAEVTNYAESGYVTFQDVSMLLSRLHRGNVPDLVVFYGGVDDVFSALQNGVAGIPQNEVNRRREFNVLQPENVGKLLPVLTSGTQYFAGMVRRRLMRNTAGAVLPEAGNRSALAQAVIEQYCANLRTVRGLAREYGFRALFFWQPVIFTKPTLTSYEVFERDRYGYARDFFAETYKRMADAPPSCRDLGLDDVSRVFENDARPYYIDAFHVTEAGNQRVAAAMLPIVIESLASPLQNGQWTPTTPAQVHGGQR